MPKDNLQGTHSNELPSPLLLAGGIGGAALCVSVLVGSLWKGDEAMFPYVWRDVALVHFLGALPLGACLAMTMRRRISPVVCLVVGAVCCGASVLFVSAAVLNADATPQRIAVSGLPLRAGPALCAAVGAALVVLALYGARFKSHSSSNWGNMAAQCVLGLAFLLLAPAVYVGARAKHDVSRLAGLLEQSRLGEAAVLSHGILTLVPDAKVNGRPLVEVSAEVERIVVDLAAQSSAPLAASATDGKRVDRARSLAMLGQVAAAIGVLDTSPNLAESGEACNLRGTIYETQEQWTLALDGYTRAKRAWQDAPHMAEQSTGLVRAVTGIAYCQRKSGDYSQAEATYQELLALAPTADTHFLLAGFYEDAQQSAPAQLHAQRAMELAPDRYEAAGKRLIDKLATHHFGCWSVSAKRD